MWINGTYFVDKYRAWRKKCGKPAVSAERIRKYRQLYPGKNPEEILRDEDGRMIIRTAAITAAGILFAVAVLVLFGQRESITLLQRADYGQGASTYELEAEKDDGDSAYIEVEVPARAYTEPEAEEMIAAAYEEICVTMLGDNESLSHVDTDLALPETAADGEVKATWMSTSRELLSDYGEILKPAGELDEDGEEGSYALELSCGGVSAEYEITIVVYAPKQTPEEEFSSSLTAEVERIADENTEEAEVILPESYGGENLTWYETEDAVAMYAALMIPVVAVAFLFVYRRQREKEALSARENEMISDYPELVSEFTVLLQAGMTARNVWGRLVRDYEKRKEEGEKPRYVYEEMCITWNQLENGAYESRAYGDFGRRCGLQTYMRFGALLEQNLRHGTTGLADRFKEESDAAFEERKNLARRLGEEAETRLMLPMFMMLFVVLAVIMIPAFLSF